MLTDTNGNFSITNDYTCPSGAYVYLLALGGNPGLTAATNSEIALAAGLGTCASLTSSSYFTINEVTTVAFAYSLSSYATSETQISTSADVSSQFANITNLIDPVHGGALATDANYIRPQQKINSLANTLAACVNSNGIGAPCSTLMSDAGVSGSGSTPVDTFQAVLNISQNPTNNVAALYSLASAGAAFQPALTSAPSDWTIAAQVNTAPSAPNLPVPPAPTYTAPAFTPPSMPPQFRRGARPRTPGAPSFFDGSVAVPGSQYEYLAFANGTVFGYYYMPDSSEFYHVGLGYEYVYDDGQNDGAIYLYDYTSTHFWYTSPSLYPYIYDYSLNSFLYYFAGSNPREFYDFATSQYIIE